jgi:hypothetical protein
MKHNHGKNHIPSSVPVRFEFTHPGADSVRVAGTFNHWRPEANAMHPLGGGRWLEESALLPGAYEYCLVVDGKWMPDPLAKETVPNPFGGLNSVLEVAIPPTKAWPVAGVVKQLAAKNSVRHLSSGIAGAAAILLMQSGSPSFPSLHLFGSQAPASSRVPIQPSQSATFCADCAKPASFVVEYHGVDSWYATTNGSLGHEVTVIQCKSCGHKTSFQRQIRNLAQGN